MRITSSWDHTPLQTQLPLIGQQGLRATTRRVRAPDHTIGSEPSRAVDMDAQEQEAKHPRALMA